MIYGHNGGYVHGIGVQLNGTLQKYIGDKAKRVQIQEKNQEYGVNCGQCVEDDDEIDEHANTHEKELVIGKFVLFSLFCSSLLARDKYLYELHKSCIVTRVL